MSEYDTEQEPWGGSRTTQPDEDPHLEGLSAGTPCAEVSPGVESPTRESPSEAPRDREPVSPSAVEAERLGDLLGEIAELEARVATLHGELVVRTAQFTLGSREVLRRCSGGGFTDQAQRLVAIEVAEARRISVGAAEHFICDAVRLVKDLPGVLGVLQDGRTSLAAVRAVAAETTALQPQSLALADEILADDLLDTAPSQARRVARTRVFEIDPGAAYAVAASAREDRFVCLSPSAAAGMACLSAVLPAEQAAACLAELRRHAVAVRASAAQTGSVSQLMADTLVERVTGLTSAEPTPVTVNLVMSDTTLLGLDDQPAQLPGHGPIPAGIARWLTAHHSTWVRRLYTDPRDATVAVADTTRRRFDAGLRSLILARDQTCRAPGCTATIRDIDHTTPFASGGPTTASNGRSYCRRCHRAKHHPAVTIRTTRHADTTQADTSRDDASRDDAIRDDADRTDAGLAVPDQATRHAGTRRDDATTARDEPRRGPAPDVIGHDAYTRWTTPIGPDRITIPPPALGPGSTTRRVTSQRRQRQLLHSAWHDDRDHGPQT
jgi:hypothetical protein